MSSETVQLLADDPEKLASHVEEIHDSIQDLWDKIDQLEQKDEETQAAIDRLENELKRLDSRTDLLELVDQADELNSEQRSIALIQHLKRAAERKRERGRPAKAAVDRDGAEQALQYPDVDRTTIYTDMRRAERLVDNTSLLKYETDDKGTRLKLDLEEGRLPSDALGSEGLNGGN